MSKISYQPYQNRQRVRWVIVVILILTSFAGGVAGGWYLLQTSGRKALVETGKLNRELQAARDEIQDLTRQLAIIENSGRVDRMAARGTQDDLRNLQDQLAEAGRELEFYKRIISPEQRNHELRIQGLKLLENSGNRFVLTVSQGVARENAVSGVAKLQFRGKMNAENFTFGLREVDSEKRDKLGFSFKYFQTLSGSLEFPQGFELESIEVSIRSSDGSVSQVRDWSVEALRAGANQGSGELGETTNLN